MLGVLYGRGTRASVVSAVSQRQVVTARAPARPQQPRNCEFRHATRAAGATMKPLPFPFCSAIQIQIPQGRAPSRWVSCGGAGPARTCLAGRQTLRATVKVSSRPLPDRRHDCLHRLIHIPLPTSTRSDHSAYVAVRRPQPHT